MAVPVLSALALAPLRAVDEAGLTHRVILESASAVRQAGGKIVTTWVTEPEQACRLNPLGLDSRLRAEQPSSARKWTLALRSGSTVVPGQRALVSGTTNGQAWQRLLTVDDVEFPRSDELRRVCLCSDVEINQ